MRLDYDCVRDTLLAIERLSGFDERYYFVPVTVFEIQEQITKYGIDQVYYTLRKLAESGLVDSYFEHDYDEIYNFMVLSLTYQGHQYLDSVRDARIWNTIKSKTASLTYSAIIKLAETLIVSHYGS